MGKKKKKQFNPVLYYVGSHIKKSSKEWICDMLAEGITVYVISGAPINPPPFPPK